MKLISQIICIFSNSFLWIDLLSTSSEIGLNQVPQKLTDEKSTLVKVTTWCHVFVQDCGNSSRLAVELLVLH